MAGGMEGLEGGLRCFPYVTLNAGRAEPLFSVITTGASNTFTTPARKTWPRHLSRRARIVFVCFLVLAVIVLSYVFVWVLLHEPGTLLEP